MKPQMWTLAVLVVATVAFGAQQESPRTESARAAARRRGREGARRGDSADAAPPEDRQYADIDGRRMKQFLMEVDAISLKDRDSGNLFWGRNVGTAGHVATQDWVEGYFRKHGLQNIHRMPFDLQPEWTPKAGTSPSRAAASTFKLKSARPAARAASTPPAGSSSTSSGSAAAPPPISSAATSRARRC